MKFEFETPELEYIGKLKSGGNDESMIISPDTKHITVTFEISDYIKAEAFLLSLLSSQRSQQNNETIGCSISEIHLGVVMNGDYLINIRDSLNAMADKLNQQIEKRS